MPVASNRARRRAGQKPTAPTKKQTTVRSRRPAARERSAQATRALDVFGELRHFFVYDAQLAQALGWDEATAAQWRDRLVIRPQRVKTMQVLFLYEIAREARAYLERDVDVGEWLNAPLPNLRGGSPARWVRERGLIGLRELTHGMVDWMPRLPDRELEAVNEEEAMAYLDAAAEHDAGAREFKRMLADLG
jgi:hypothetical protein